MGICGMEVSLLTSGNFPRGRHGGARVSTVELTVMGFPSVYASFIHPPCAIHGTAGPFLRALCIWSRRGGGGQKCHAVDLGQGGG